MKNAFKWLGIIALAAIIEFSFSACGDGEGGNNGDPDLSGSITISPSGTVFTNTELTATYSGNEAVSYQWKNGTNNVGTNSDKFTPTEAGSYTVTVNATGYNSKTSDTVIVTTSYYAKWESTVGRFQPYTLTVTADSIEWKDKDGDYIKYSDITWTAAENKNDDYKTNYPHGFTFTGTRTGQTYTDGFTFGFIALSTDGNSIYLGRNDTTSITNEGYNDTTFTKKQ